MNGEQEPVWLSPHLRDIQPERERKWGPQKVYFVDNKAEERGRKVKDGPVWSTTSWKSYDSKRRTQRIMLNGEEEPVWLTLEEIERMRSRHRSYCRS